MKSGVWIVIEKPRRHSHDTTRTPLDVADDERGFEPHDAIAGALERRITARIRALVLPTLLATNYGRPSVAARCKQALHILNIARVQELPVTRRDQGYMCIADVIGLAAAAELSHTSGYRVE